MTRTMPNSEKLPYALYRSAQVRELDRCAIEDHGIAGLTLMQRAGAAAFALAQSRWPAAGDITVLCGIGNNAGDGYVLARLALQASSTVRVLQLGDPGRLKGDALVCASAYREAGGEVHGFEGLPARTDLVVDAVFGTGLEREVAGKWLEAVRAVNDHPAPVLALDLPSGLHADSGRILGGAVRASATISFIGLKQGMFTAEGPACCGEISFDALQVPAVIYSKEILSARRLDWRQQSSRHQPRSRSAHKGDFGHVLLIGGELGFSGALRLAGEAAARSGAGLVSLATRPQHTASLPAGRPELMCHGIERARDLNPLLKRATVIAIGPGLGQSKWAQELFCRALESRLPLVVDADALNLLAAEPMCRDDWVLTPHPGEAARLLGCSVAEIQADRFGAASLLQQRFAGHAVLKGAGTLICGPDDRPIGVCSDGNPGMASGGMGDLLTGIIGGLLAQGYDAGEACSNGVCLHAAAGDRAAEAGEKGMLAGDLLPHIRHLLNQVATAC